MSPSSPMRYADSSAFLLSQIGARTAQLFAQRLAPLGASPRAFGVLSNLVTGEAQTQQQLADALGIHRNNMVALIDEIEAAGWVERRRSAADRRAFEIHPTRAGRTLVATVNEQIPALEDELARELTAEERRRLRSLLTRIADGLGLHPGVHPHLNTRAR